jgi:hypothetical protein
VLPAKSMAAIVMVLALCFGATALAHFNLNMNVRIIHVEHLAAIIHEASVLRLASVA